MIKAKRTNGIITSMPLRRAAFRPCAAPAQSLASRDE